MFRFFHSEAVKILERDATVEILPSEKVHIQDVICIYLSTLLNIVNTHIEDASINNELERHLIAMADSAGL